MSSTLVDPALGAEGFFAHELNKTKEKIRTVLITASFFIMFPPPNDLRNCIVYKYSKKYNKKPPEEQIIMLFSEPFLT